MITKCTRRTARLTGAFLGAALLSGIGAQATTFNGNVSSDFTDTMNWTGGYPSTSDWGQLDMTAELSNTTSNDIQALRMGVDTGTTGELNILPGANLSATAHASWGSWIGGNSAGIVNQSGGIALLNEVEIGRNSGATGAYNLSGGLLNINRSLNSYSLYIGTSKDKTTTATGSLEISGGTLITRAGVYLGSSDDSGVGTFSVLGSLAKQIGIGSNSSGDGLWYQNAGSTLQVGIDPLGLTKILIDEVDGDGGQAVTFEAGALLKVDYYNGGAGGGTWTVMELENADIVDNGLAFSADVDTTIWSFKIDNSGTNGLLTVTAIGDPMTTTDVTVSSIDQLQQYTIRDNVNVTMTPGTYTIKANDITSGLCDQTVEMGDSTYNNILLFSGNNSTYDFADVTLSVESGIWQQDYGTAGIHELQVTGNSNLIKNLTMVDVGELEDYPVDACVNVVMDGCNNQIEGFDMSIKGSYPYGYGDCFGKGSTFTIKHFKHSAVLVRGDDNYLKNCTLTHRSFGHAIFMQAASNPTIEGCYIEGEMRSSDDMLAETSGPAFDIDFMTVWGYRLVPGYMKSTGEGGIRSYNAGTTLIDGVVFSRGTSNPTILDNTIVNMRTGVALTLSTGTKYVSGCTAIGCEQGFATGTGGIIENCAADAQYGPVFGDAYASDNGIVADITILPYEGDHYNGSGHVAFIAGQNHDLTFHGMEGGADQTLAISIGGNTHNLSDYYAADSYSADDIVINNYTGYPLVMDNESTGISGESIGPITDSGSGNSLSTVQWRDPIADWTLNDGSGSSVADETGNGLDATLSGATWQAGVNGTALAFDGTHSTVTLPANAFNSISNEITVAMWAYGSTNQPQNNSVLYAVNSAGGRVLNVHLPWSNGTIYWDAGYDGNYDRINKAASADEYKGQWNHWVFTKNASTGEMAIYLNGSLWHSGTSKTRPMNGITAATLGSQISGVTYDGLIDDVQLYNVSLDATEVSDLYTGLTVTNDVPVTWLVANGIEPTDAGALADTDGDGLANWEEYLAGKDPSVPDSSPGLRVTEYYLSTGDFPGTNCVLSLNNVLADNYFILVRGSRDGDGLSMPNNDYARITAVPFAIGDMDGSGSRFRINLERSVADADWEGVVTIVECTNPNSPSGFKLVDILSTDLSGTAGTDTAASWSDVNQVVLFGGYRGGGAAFVGTPTSRNHGTSLYTRLYPSGSNTLNWSRNAGGETLFDAVMTTFVVEWGANWNVQHVNVSGSAGGDAADVTGEYTTAAISAVVRDNTWVWGTGTRADAGIGDSAEACLITLGDGVNQNATESSVAIGSEYTDAYDFDVYTMTHSGLAVDYRFKPDGDSASSDLAVTVDTATSGTRMGWSYNGCNGTGTYFPRPRMWARYTADGEITLSRGFSGQNFPAWIQGIDFSGVNQ